MSKSSTPPHCPASGPPIPASPGNEPGIGDEIYGFAAEIFPLFRSVTGPGVRETLARMGHHLEGLEIGEIPTGSQVYDWVIPDEWTIREAYIANERGERIVDFAVNNLHVLNYSAPIRATMPLSELKQHIYTLPDKPDLIPYRASYYDRRWGFCMSHNALEGMPDGDYTVVIDSSFRPGVMNYGEYVKPGRTDKEFLIFSHICHPSLANDNCSGLALTTMLAKRLSSFETNLTYRFVWAPTTIGSIAWLSQNEHKLPQISEGLVVTCVGDGAAPIYKQTKAGDAKIDAAMAHALSEEGRQGRVVEYEPLGYDERQFNTPGIGLNVGLFQRSQWGTFDQYHNSGDNLDFIAPEHLARSYDLIMKAINIVDHDRAYHTTVTKGEPRLGRYGLHAAYGFEKDAAVRNKATMWVLALSDGKHTLLEIATRAGISFETIQSAARALETVGLIV